MDIHKNARSCLASRALLVNRIHKEGWSVLEAAEAAGISKRSAYKWLQRFESEGLSGLADRSSRPRSHPNQISQKRVRRIAGLRCRRMTAAEISFRLRMSRSTVARILKRLGVSRLRDLESREDAIRYEREHPGELLHLDIKKLGRILRPSHRVTGNRRDTSAGAGWEYVHVCVDDASRIAYVEVLPDERQVNTTAFLRRAVAWYRKLDITTQRILTDNGSAYRSKRFARACKALGIKHTFTRPYRPQTNGKAERLIQTLLREWAYRFSFKNSRSRTRRLRYYLHFYNCHRMHQALGMLPPISRLPAVNNLLGMHN